MSWCVRDTNTTLLDAVNQALAIVSSRGGPGLPKPEGETLEDQARHWELLTCKEVKASATKLQGRTKVGKKDQKENKTVIHISSESMHMLAPFDYNIQYVVSTPFYSLPVHSLFSSPPLPLPLPLTALIPTSFANLCEVPQPSRDNPILCSVLLNSLIPPISTSVSRSLLD